MVCLLLLCGQKTFYSGITPDLVRRFKQHINKNSFFTKKFSDIKLVYCEKYTNKYDAAKREKQIKGWSHSKKQTLVDGLIGINNCTEIAVALLKGENLM